MTLFVGPHTRLALALNAQIRQRRAEIAASGLWALPSRIASPLSRRLAAGDAPAAERFSEFEGALGAHDGRPVLLAALNFLGAPEHAISGRDLFPEMGALFAGLAEALPKAPTVVVSVEPLHVFFASAASDPLAARVARTGWETLYEISWADLVTDIRIALPQAKLHVMTPETAVLRPVDAAKVLFGEAADCIDPATFRDAHLSAEGRAVSKAMPPDQQTDTVLLELMEKLGNAPAAETLETRLDIDALTAELLRQRFHEDVEKLATFDGVNLL